MSNQAKPQGDDCNLNTTINPKFIHNATDVGFDGVWAEVKGGCDRWIATTFY
jgi:hypothetical protein